MTLPSAFPNPPCSWPSTASPCPRTALECLTGRTEGWAAGVRLAAISLDGHPDPEQFVKELDAEDSAVTSYLVDEVLERPARLHQGPSAADQHPGPGQRGHRRRADR